MTGGSAATVIIEGRGVESSMIPSSMTAGSAAMGSATVAASATDIIDPAVGWAIRLPTWIYPHNQFFRKGRLGSEGMPEPGLP